MAVLGGIAAPNVSTFETHSQVYPCVASRDAFGAFPSRWFGEEGDLGQVNADRRHHPIRAIVAGLGGKTVSIPPEEIEKAGFIGRLIATNMVVSTEKAKRELGWQPSGPSLLAELRTGSYAS